MSAQRSIEDDISLTDDSDDETTTSTTSSSSSSSSSTHSPKTKKKTLQYRMKNHIAGKAATSFGYTLFQKYADDETISLLSNLQILVANQYGKEKGKEVKKNIIKIVIKVLLLVEDKHLVGEDFQEIYGLFRKICSLFKNTYYRELTNRDLAKSHLDPESAKRISDFGTEMETKLKKVLKPHISSTSADRISSIFGYLKNQEFVIHSFSAPEFAKIVVVLAYYLEKYK